MSADSDDSTTIRSVTQNSSLFEDSISPFPMSSVNGDSVLTTSLAGSVCRVPKGIPESGDTFQNVSSYEDMSKYKLECRHLRGRIKQLQTENQSEQDANIQLRKKLSNVERERLESASKANEEISTLQNQLAKLRSQLEKGEAVRQDLEFELAKSKRQISQEKRNASEREIVMTDVSENMKSKVNNLNLQIQELHGQLQEYKKTSEDEERRLRRSLQEKEDLIASSQAETDSLEQERDRLQGLIQEKELIEAEMNDQITHLEDEKEKMSDNIRRQLNDINYGKEREDRLKQDLEVALQRIKTLEDSIEAERAAHLESKFNSEIVQLRVRDLETAVDTEKSAKQEEKSVVDSLTGQLRELENAYAEERKMSKHTREVLEKTEKEYNGIQKQLSVEVESKKNMISNLSEQLKIHQKNFDELKEELRKAKKRQAYLEDTYGGSMRDLELMVQNYQLDTSLSKRRQKDRKDRAKPPSPSVVLDSLRQTLGAYKKKVEATSDELKKSKHMSSNLVKEGDSYKVKLRATEKTLEDTRDVLEQTTKELERTRNECTELEAHIASFKVDVQSLSRNYEKEKGKYHETSDEIVKLAKKYKNDEEDKVHFLHQLYQRVLGMHRIPHMTGKVDYNKYSWVDLSNLVQDEIGSLITSLQNAEEKVKHLEGSVHKLEEAAAEMQHEHTTQIDRMTLMAHDQEVDWQRQKQELEDHYTLVLSEVHGRSQKSQAMMDQAWEKVRVTGSIQQGLESECVELRTLLHKNREQKAALHTTCALLIGAYFPLYSRLVELSTQRALLLHQLDIAETAKNNAQVLVETLSNEMDRDFAVPKRKLGPLLRFRIAAVAVMAANRLQYFGCHSSRMFTTHEGLFRDGNAVICCGVLPKTSGPFRGVASMRGQGFPNEGEGAALSWLTSGDLLEIIMSSTTELQNAVLRLRDGGGQTDTKLLVTSARSSFHKMMEKFEKYYQTTRPGSFSACIRDRSSLVHNLGYSLGRTLGQMPSEKCGSLISFKQTMSSLQHRLLEFTQRLHSAEVDRRNLRVELTQSQEENAQLSRTTSKLGHVEEDLRSMKIERKNLVETKRFDGVCLELEAALKREQQAQQLLNEQSDQLHELSRKLDSQASEGADKDNTLQEAVQGLSQTKLELRRKEQVLKQLDEHIQNLEVEKKDLENGVYDAERALRMVAKDKDALTNYIKTVEGAFQRAKSEVALSRGYTRSREFSLSKILLSTELLPSDTGQIGPEMVAFQSLIGCFVDAQQQAFSKIEALEEEIESHRRHVSTLKNELNAACRRELEEDVPSFNSRLRSSTGLPEERNRREDFAPLIEDTDPSLSQLKPPSDSPRTRSYRTSPRGQDSGRTPQYHTPSLSRRHPNLRPKASDNLYR